MSLKDILFPPSPTTRIRLYNSAPGIKDLESDSQPDMKRATKRSADSARARLYSFPVDTAAAAVAAIPFRNSSSHISNVGFDTFAMAHD